MMAAPDEISVWRVSLDDLRPESLPASTPGELARADRFLSPEVRERYLRAHAALRRILGQFTAAPLDFAVTDGGKPYLPQTPELRFNLSRSHGMALIAVSLGTDVGVDIERIRPMTDHLAIAERFFPPSEWVALATSPEPDREAEFFRRWTRIEARLKALGVGLYGSGKEFEGGWTLESVDAAPGFAAAAAARRPAMKVRMVDYESAAV